VVDRSPLFTALSEARGRTLALVASLSDADVETAHTTLMSPLVWDLAHIAAYEDLWLVHRFAGEPLLQPELAAMYDAFETPRAVRGDLPLLDRAQALDYLATVRARAAEVADRNGSGDGVLHEMVLRHEHQHDETMLQAMELARLAPPPALPRAPRPAAPPGHTGLEGVEVPAHWAPGRTALPTTTSARAMRPTCGPSASAARRSRTPRT
jgi:gamma-glutamyl hercynylcysteine S-oxide synthase